MIAVAKEEVWAAPSRRPYMIAVPGMSEAARSTGRLAFPKGTARSAVEIYPDLPDIALRIIHAKYPGYHPDATQDYSFVEVFPPPHGIGLFQTRRAVSSPACLEAIRRSTEMLDRYARPRPC